MDFWISSPDLPTLEAVAQQVPGLWVPPVTDAQTGETTPGHIIQQYKRDDGTEWVWTPWGFWNKPTGQTTTDAMGNTVPVLSNDGHFYSLARWNGNPVNIPFATAGGTMNTDPETNITTITAGPVTMVSPLPPDCPVSF